MKIFGRTTALLVCAVMIFTAAAGLSSCSKKEEPEKGKAMFTLNAKVFNRINEPAAGLTAVLCSINGDVHTAPIAEDGSFTVGGLLLDDTVSFTIEDDRRNVYTEITYLTVVGSEEVGLGPTKGVNSYGYLNIGSTKETKNLYATFRLNKKDYLDCTYLSAECLEPDETTTNVTTTNVTTTNVVL